MSKTLELMKEIEEQKIFISKCVTGDMVKHCTKVLHELMVEFLYEVKKEELKTLLKYKKEFRRKMKDVREKEKPTN